MEISNYHFYFNSSTNCINIFNKLDLIENKLLHNKLKIINSEYSELKLKFDKINNQILTNINVDNFVINKFNKMTNIHIAESENLEIIYKGITKYDILQEENKKLLIEKINLIEEIKIKEISRNQEIEDKNLYILNISEQFKNLNESYKKDKENLENENILLKKCSFELETCIDNLKKNLFELNEEKKNLLIEIEKWKLDKNGNSNNNFR